MISDEQIIEGCLSGKRKAYNMLYRKYASAMLGICMRYCKNRDDAEDVLQEGFIKVFTKMENYRHEGSFEGWIKRIMINSAIDHYQARLRHVFHEDVDELDGRTVISEESVHGPDSPQTADISKEKLMEMIQSLPDGYRMVFNLYAIEGLSHKEIAENLNISENTSKTQLMKARRNLRQKVGMLVGRHEHKKQVI